MGEARRRGVTLENLKRARSDWRVSLAPAEKALDVRELIIQTKSADAVHDLELRPLKGHKFPFRVLPSINLLAIFNPLG